MQDAQDQAAATDEEIDSNVADTVGEADESFNPSDELKAAYRHSAKMMHPDRAMGEEDRFYRNEMMAQVNVAYERLDLREISRLVNEFHAEANIGGGIERELVLLIRQEAALRERLTEIGRDIAAFDGDETMKLKAYCAETKLAGRDALSELAAEVRDEIAALKKRAVEPRAVVEAAEKSREASVIAGATATPQGRGREGSSGVHIHRTDRGDFVRSKFELVIANVLHALSLNYKYEQQIVGRNTGGKMLPDFVFISSRALAEKAPVV